MGFFLRVLRLISSFFSKKIVTQILTILQLFSILMNYRNYLFILIVKKKGTLLSKLGFYIQICKYSPLVKIDPIFNFSTSTTLIHNVNGHSESVNETVDFFFSKTCKLEGSNIL